MSTLRYVAPLIAGICAINAGACGMAAIDANAKTGFPYGLIVGFAVWFGSSARPLLLIDSATP